MGASNTRYSELKKMLENRQRELVVEIRGETRGAVVDRGLNHEVRDEGETAEHFVQEDLRFSISQMKADILEKINAALIRLENGNYGSCLRCEKPISEIRLRALPFAVRCKDCEESHELERSRFNRSNWDISTAFDSEC